MFLFLIFTGYEIFQKFFTTTIYHICIAVAQQYLIIYREIEFKKNTSMN